MPFAPRVSIVTGGASGIGRALATELIARGGRVVVADLDVAAAQRAAAELGRNASWSLLDVADTAAVADLVREVAGREGRLDLMVNNAGILLNGPADEYTDAHWDRALAVNLRGVIAGAQAAYAVMREQGHGTILNTGSLAGLMVSPRMLPYTVTKQGVVAYTRALAIEARPVGVGVHVLCPDFVDTKLLDEAFDPSRHAGSFRAYATSLQPRLTTPETVARRALRGVERGRVVIPIGVLAHVLWRAERLLPGVADFGSGIAARAEDRKAGRDPGATGRTAASPVDRAAAAGADR